MAFFVMFNKLFRVIIMTYSNSYSRFARYRSLANIISAFMRYALLIILRSFNETAHKMFQIIKNIFQFENHTKQDK